MPSSRAKPRQSSAPDRVRPSPVTMRYGSSAVGRGRPAGDAVVEGNLVELRERGEGMAVW